MIHVSAFIRPSFDDKGMSQHLVHNIASFVLLLNIIRALVFS